MRTIVVRRVLLRGEELVSFSVYALMKASFEFGYIFHFSDSFPSIESVNLFFQQGTASEVLGGMYWQPFTVDAEEYAELRDQFLAELGRRVPKQ